jgi:hypothetical protein
MLADRQIMDLEVPPGLTDAEIDRWWDEKLSEPDGSIILGGGFDKPDTDGRTQLQDHPQRR